MKEITYSSDQIWIISICYSASVALYPAYRIIFFAQRFWSSVSLHGRYFSTIGILMYVMVSCGKSFKDFKALHFFVFQTCLLVKVD